MTILIIGTGYVGLTTGACFAEMGHKVICHDIDEVKIGALNSGRIPIYEPGLEELVKRNTAAKRLSFTTDLEKGVKESLVCFLAVSTPSQEDGSCDLSHILQAASAIGAVMPEYRIIVSKSTVPVGTAELIKAAIKAAQKTNIEFDIVSNPEFLKEGSAISDCMKPDRIIIGVESEKALQIMREIYSAFTLNHDRMIIMDIASAEMTKYAANAMLATRISFMNEIAGLCEKLGANINQVRIGIGSDHRIGFHFLYAGVGYGGSCFPKDIRALQALGRSVGCATPLLEAVDAINQNQKKLLGKKIRTYFSKKGGLKNKTIAIWGLSFKPDTDDVREAPALELIRELLAEGVKLRLFDPVAMQKMALHFKDHSNICWCQDEYEAAMGSDAVALVTEWKQFRFVNFDELKPKMKGHAIFDGRNQYKKTELAGKGFLYFGIGVGTDSLA